MRVLGIDCGVERTGYGVIESDGRTHSLLVAGVIRTSPSARLEARLLRIAEGLRETIRLHAPVSAAVEEVFHAVNVKTATQPASPTISGRRTFSRGDRSVRSCRQQCGHARRPQYCP